MSQYLPRFMSGDTVPLTASAAIVGASPVTTAGAPAGDASSTVAGIAGYDAVSGQSVTVFREGIHIGTASGAIANGDPLCTAVAVTPGVTPVRLRKWITGTDPVTALIGRAWSAAADGQPVTYALLGV